MNVRSYVTARIPAFAIVAALGLWEAWRLRFIQDDAYISFRYADNLARGLGLVWNAGERVEGYTNFLWTVILVIPHVLGLDVERFAVLLGLALFTITLAIFYGLVDALTRSRGVAAVATLVLATFPSFAAFATGGLETQLLTCLVTSTVALVVSGIRREQPSAFVSAGIGTTAALAMLTRMDSFVIVAPVIALYAWFFLTAHGWRSKSALVPAIGIPMIICGGWLSWKLFYYGTLLPNSYRAKVEGMGALMRQGARYVLTFVQAYAFYLPIACVPIGTWLAWERRLDRRLLGVVLLPLALWTAYVVRVGGDFMEYRFIVPVLPLAILLTYWVMCEIDRQPVRAALLTSIVFAGGLSAYSSSKVPKPVGSPLPMQDLAVHPDLDWYEIGTVLGDAFAGSLQPKIAVVPAGVIPYRSRLPAVDMLGLNDSEVRSFIHLPYELVGHRRLAPLDVLERRRVHFLIAFPVVRPRLAPGTRFKFVDFAERPYAYDNEYRLKGRQIIEVPLPRGRVLFMVYLTEDHAITTRLDSLGWRHYPLE